MQIELCVICDDALDGIHQTACQMCEGRFHKPWESDSQIPECGWIAMLMLWSLCFYAMIATKTEILKS